MEDSLGQVKTLFDGVTSRGNSVLDKNASEESFNVERFKERLYTMSHTATKEASHKVTTDHHQRSQAVITPETPFVKQGPGEADTPAKTVGGGSVTNIVIKPMAEDDQDSVYEQIKRKYLKEQ